MRSDQGRCYKIQERSISTMNPLNRLHLHAVSLKLKRLQDSPPNLSLLFSRPAAGLNQIIRHEHTRVSPLFFKEFVVIKERGTDTPQGLRISGCLHLVYTKYYMIYHMVYGFTVLYIVYG